MTNKWVTVPVREEDVVEVLEWVLAKEKGRPERGRIPAEVNGDGVQTYHGGFTEEELRDMLLKPTRSMGILLRYFATHPEKPVTRKELAEMAYEGADNPERSLNGGLGSFTKRNRGRYGKDTWPFQIIEYNDNLQQWMFKMDAKTAEAIRRILGL